MLVPVGFIYVELPGQKDPRNLWPMVEWTDASPEYAGLFFRVLGGGSQAFGALQNENSNRLTNVHTTMDNSFKSWNSEVIPGSWSPWITTGTWSGDNIQTQFLLSSGEVRPRNKAIRIWKRTK